MTTDWNEARRQSEEGVPYVLNCTGRDVRVRPLDFQLFVNYGEIPDYLTPVVDELLERGRAEPEDRKKIPITTASARSMAALQAAFVKAVLAWPRVVDDPKEDGEIGVTTLKSAEILELWELGTKPHQLMELFRQEQNAPAESVQPDEDNGENA